MKATLYLHGSKESNYDKGSAMGLTDKALDNFCYALYEVKFDLEVNEETGDYIILAVNDQTLQPK